MPGALDEAPPSSDFSGFRCDPPCCEYKTVVCYETHYEPCIQTVTCYDECGRPYTKEVTTYHKVRVAVQKVVKVCY